jgi:hypothetical protein
VLATLSRWRSRVQIPSGPLSTGQVAQLVEHTTENRGVGGSIPPLTTARAVKRVTSSGEPPGWPKNGTFEKSSP